MAERSANIGYCLLEYAVSVFLDLNVKFPLSDNRASSKQAMVCDNGAFSREGSPSSGEGRVNYHA